MTTALPTIPIGTLHRPATSTRLYSLCAQPTPRIRLGIESLRHFITRFRSLDPTLYQSHPVPSASSSPLITGHCPQPTSPPSSLESCRLESCVSDPLITHLRPGDVIHCHTGSPQTPEKRAEALVKLRKFFPNNPILTTSCDSRLTIIRQEEVSSGQ